MGAIVVVLDISTTPMAKKIKKDEEEEVVEKVKETPASTLPEGYDPDLPDNKQRWLRE